MKLRLCWVVTLHRQGPWRTKAKKSNGWKSLSSLAYSHEIFMILANVEFLQAFGLCICIYV